MATLHRDIPIHAPVDQVWEAIRDVGRPHERIVPGVLTDATYDGVTRTVTFADGFVATERIVAVDEERHRVAYAVVDGPFEHHHASMEVVAGPDGTSRVLWTTDLLPEDVVPFVDALVDQGARAMQATLASDVPAAGATLAS